MIASSECFLRSFLSLLIYSCQRRFHLAQPPGVNSSVSRQFRMEARSKHIALLDSHDVASISVSIDSLGFFDQLSSSARKTSQHFNLV